MSDTGQNDTGEPNTGENSTGQDESVVLYEERDGIAIITLNRPAKKNTLTDAVVQGVADGVDAATKSRDVAAIILRGSGDTLTAGYDLNPQSFVFGRAGGPWLVNALRCPGSKTQRWSVGPGQGLSVHEQQRSPVHEDLGMPKAGAR